MELVDALMRLFDLFRHWNMRARGFGFLLALPVLIVAIADWRIRRPR